MNNRGSRLWLNLLLLLLVLQPISLNAIDRLSASIFKFIYSHESICGDQFGDLSWMPAHDHCELNCDLLSEICQLYSERSSDTKQRCLKLPNDCSTALSLHLYSLGLTEKRRTEARFDGITISGTTSGNVQFGYSTSKPTSEPIKPHGLGIRHIEEERITVTSAPDSLIEGQFREFQSNFNEFFSKEQEEGETIDPQVTLMSQEPETTTSLPEYADQTFDNNIFMSDRNIFEQSPAPDISTTPAFEFQEVSSTDSRLEMPSSVPTPPSEVNIFGPPFVERQNAAPTFPLDSDSDSRRLPTSLADFDRERQKQPWSWKNLSDRLKRPWSLQNRPDKDLSHRCCQWALDGLCDRSWQRVRVLCPKSCGTVVCSSSDGALSCNRAIDVDVVDCYEKRKHNLQSISNRFYDTQPSSLQVFPEEPVNPLNMLPEEMHFGWTSTKSNTVPTQYFPTGPTLHNRMQPAQRAYAVEAEIKKFKSSRNFG